MSPPRRVTLNSECLKQQKWRLTSIARLLPAFAIAWTWIDISPSSSRSAKLDKSISSDSSACAPWYWRWEYVVEITIQYNFFFAVLRAIIITLVSWFSSVQQVWSLLRLLIQRLICARRKSHTWRKIQRLSEIMIDRRGESVIVKHILLGRL